MRFARFGKRPPNIWRYLACVVFAFLCVTRALSSEATNNAAGLDLSRLKSMSMDELMAVEVPVVYGASRYEQKLTEAPASISIVTADEIQKFGHRTLAEVLRSVRGVYVSYDRNYSYLGIRGFNRPGDYNSRVLTLINGHRINDNVYDQATSGTEFLLDVDLIDRVEVIRGPSSSIYGSSAFFGVINVITKKGRDFNGVEGSLEAGAFDTYKGRGTFGQKFTNGLELLVSGSYFTSSGEGRLFYPEFRTATSDGIARHADGDIASRIFSSISYYDFTLSGGFVRRDKEVPTAAYDTLFGDDQHETIDQRGYVALTYQHAFSHETELSVRVAYDNFRFDGRYPYEAVGLGNANGVLINADKAQGDWVTAESQLKQELGERVTFSAGVEYRANLQQFQMNYDEEPYTEYFRSKPTSWSFGAYSQAEIAIRTNLITSAGLRYDYYDDIDSSVNPRAALIYAPWQPSTLKLLYGSAFRAPNVYERYYADDGYTKPNPDLDPETICTYEVVWEQRVAKHWQVTLSGYYYEVDDLISQTIDPNDGLLVFENVDTAQGLGFEWEVAYKTEHDVLIRASHAIQRTEDRETGIELSNSPRHVVKLNATVPIYPKYVFGGIELQYNSPVETIREKTVDDFWTVNATVLSRNIVKGLEISASVYNVFDQDYAYPAGGEHRQIAIPQEGRSFRVKLTYRF